MIEVDLPNSPEALHLEQLTGIENAWAFVARLWMWGIQNNVSDGRVRLSRARVAVVSGRSARSSHLVEHMITAGFLEPGRDARGDYLYMKGWDRNASYFLEKEKDRARKKRERLNKMSGGHSADIPPDVRRTNGGPLSLSLSPSLPHSSSEEGNPPTHGTPIRLQFANQAQIPADLAKRLWDAHGEALAYHKRPSRSGLIPTPIELDLCRHILWETGSLDAAKNALDAYVACETNKFWKSKGWPLWLLDKDLTPALELSRMPLDEAAS